MSRGQVLQLCHTRLRRGAEIFASELGPSLVAAGFEVETKALLRGDDPHPLPIESLSARRRSVGSLRRLRADVQRFDALVSFGSGTLAMGAAAVAGGRVPFVYRTIGDPSFWGRARLRQVRIGLPMRRAERVVALWPGAADVLRDLYGLSEERVQVIANGRDVTRYVPPTAAQRLEARRAIGVDDPDRPVVAFVAMLSWEKDPLVAVEAAARVPDAVLVVAGHGPLRPEVEARAEALAPGRVRFLGSLADVRSAYHAADAQLLTSRTEGMPGCLIEGGMCDVPTVATDVGGTSEVVRPDTGRLVPPGDATATAAALVAVLERRAELGPAAGRWCRERFATDQIGQRWAGLLDDVIGARGRRAGSDRPPVDG